MSTKALKKMQFFKPFDISTSTRCDQEHVLYVQAALFPFAGATNPSKTHGNNKDDDNEENINETWFCMFTSQRFIICKKNDEGMIIDRKQLNYQNIAQYKLKKNKRFKKSNLPAIKVYIDDGSHQNNNKDDIKSSLKTPSLKNLKKDKDDDKYPKVIISFNDIECRDSFHTKMLEIIGTEKTKLKTDKNGANTPSFSGSGDDEDSKDQKPSHPLNNNIQYELYNTLDVIIERQNIYNEYLTMKDNMENFRFLEPAKKQCQQMTDILNDKYILKLTRDDTKHIKAFYRSKQDNFQIRNNRKQWFINIYIATLLFLTSFPISISEELQWIWIQQICRSSIYFMDDSQLNIKCMKLMDILINKCFQRKYIKVIDTFFHEKDYQNLQILFYLMQNYINLKTSNLDNLPKLRFKQMIPLLIKNNKLTNNKYIDYFIDLINIPILKKQFKESDIYQCLISYLSVSQELNEEVNIDKDPIINALIKILRSPEKKLNKIWPENSLYLQEIIRNETDEDTALQRIQISLKLNPRLLYKTYPTQYDGMTALQFAEKKHVWPKVVQFLQNKVEGFTSMDMDISNKHIIPGFIETKENSESDDGNTNHEEGDSIIFNSLLMSDLKDKEKEKLALLAEKERNRSPTNSKTKSKSNRNPKSPISPITNPGDHHNHNQNNSFIAMVTKSSKRLLGRDNNNMDGLSPTSPGSTIKSVSPNGGTYHHSSVFSNDSSIAMENRITKELIKIERASSASKSKSPKTMNKKLSSQTPPMKAQKVHKQTANGASPWGFTNFVGSCFSFTSLNNQTANGVSHPNGAGSDRTHDLNRRLQSYITTLEKFKAKTRNLEHKIAKLNKTMEQQNEKIIELKLENKMIKNVYVNNEFKDGGNNKKYDYDENMVNKKLIKSRQWKQWKILEVIHWICTLKNGKFKRYKSTLMVNMRLRNISGKHFARIDKSDLTYFYGITDFDDVCDLYEAIEDLVANSFAE